MKIEEFSNSRVFQSRTDLLKYAIDQKIEGDGIILEFGVFKGFTINFIAQNAPNKIIYGFDSFEGLPEPWKIRDDLTYEAGHFNLNGEMPNVFSNVKLIKGLFEDSLPIWMSENKNKKIDIVHIDSDLYSSAKTVLNLLNEMLKKDTIIVFDELLKGKYYHYWEKDGEWKALNEWQTDYNKKLEVLGRTFSAEAAIKIIE